MKRECLFLTLLPLIAYANVDDYRGELQDGGWEEDQEYDGWVADQMNSGGMQQNSMQQSNGMQQNNMQQSNGMQPSSSSNQQMPQPSQPYMGQVGFFFGADYLFWTVKEGSTLQYTFTKDFPTYQSSPTTQPVAGLVGRGIKAEFDWSSGVRANAGYQFSHDHWEAYFEYTYFRSTGRKHTTRPNDNTLQGNFALGQAASVFPTAFFTVSGEVPQKYTSHIRFTENVLDLKLRKHFAPTKYFAIALSAGAESAWLDQTWRVNVTGTPPAMLLTTTKQFWKFVGVGPAIGVDLDWYFVKSFAIFLNATASVLYGFHHNNIKTLATNAFIPTYQNATTKDHRFVPHGSLQIGLSWDYRFSNNFFQIFAAYEINTWVQLQQTYHYNDNSDNTTGIDLSYSVNKDPVSTHGLTAGVEFHF